MINQPFPAFRRSFSILHKGEFAPSSAMMRDLFADLFGAILNKLLHSG